MRDEGQPQNREHRAVLFLNSVWVLLHPAELQDQGYSLSSLSEKTRESDHLQIQLLQRQHFLLSYLKT